MQKLKEQFSAASRVGGMAEVKRLKTMSGLKDTFQDFFIGRLFDASRKKGRSKEQKQQDMSRLQEGFPTITLSPVWRIRGMISPFPSSNHFT